MENVLRRFNPWAVSDIIRMDLKDVETNKWNFCYDSSVILEF